MAEVASWLDVGPDMDISDNGRCAWRAWCAWLKGCIRRALAWWRETSDVVVLNSPWLRRSFGRYFKCVCIVLNSLLWLGRWIDFSQRRRNMFRRKTIYGFDAAWSFWTMNLCLAASLWVFLRSSRESMGANVLFGIGMAISFQLLEETSLSQILEFCSPLVFALLCQSNVHPLVLFLLVSFHGYTWCTEILKHGIDVRYLSSHPTMLQMFAFECIMLAGFTWDFTQRVEAVSSGMLFGDSDELLESPVAGRSARIFCWFSGVCEWCVLGKSVLGSERWFQSHHDPFLRYQLPLSTLAVCFLALGLVLLAYWKKSSSRCWESAYMTTSAWYQDAALGFFCSAPAALLMVNLRLASFERDPKRPSLNWYQYFEYMIRISLILFVEAVQTLVQAGCHPLICAVATVILTPLALLSWPYDLLDMAPENDTNLSPAIPVSAAGWLLVCGHLIDFVNRMGAIQRGLWQSRQNAASSQMFLSSASAESVNGLELQSLWAQREALASDGSLDRLAAPSPAGPSAVVAVVRHAERADNMHSFDGWGCSKDAADFPHDPPITANGVEQAEQLADELKAEEMDFDVIVSSPFLRCLQTALILAEKFDTQVLIDQELGEVMGPPVFETEPPLPPRPWSNLKKTLEESEASSNLHTRLRAGRFMGKQPQWAETLEQARLRYVKRYLDYLRRSRHTKKNCLLVTHGHMVQACATVLPASQHRKVVSVDYCGAAVAQCYKLGKTKNEDPLCSPDGSQPAFFATESGDFQAESREKDQLLQDAKTRYWTLWLRSVRTVPSSTPAGSNLQNVGQTWKDLVKLLGVLPPVGPLPAPSVVESHAESAGTSATRTTTTSVRMLREPDQVPKSPKLSEQTEQRQESSVEVKVPLAQPKLTLSTSRLAARRGLNKPTVPATVPEDPV